ncbi:ATP-binding protein [Paractinoplanes atraurantiacus]|uniref:Anti-sigma regulatory factor (Ser/Thr protein kinase) n=1 Tax=Paractinoplanes atraurantiacus TaxID=1036182 RepID=A0A285JYS5_9ACTN|nr:ATP-binding protein [Actinoplanes atraurantiacus]SNY64231.1 Anti-sigma regulatory factor (Ser/Thr protein kinase) [Actinoplanes atraurantiacus]
MADPGPPLLRREFGLGGLVDLRHQVERSAQDSGLIDVALYRFVVAVNEITTNAVRHGGGQGLLELWRTATRLHCRVTDHGPGLTSRPPIGRPAARTLDGRGLWLAQQGCDEMVIESGARGTTVKIAVGARRLPLGNSV